MFVWSANLGSVAIITGFLSTKFRGDNSVPKDLIRVSHIIGFRAAFVGDDMSQVVYTIQNLNKRCLRF